MWFARASYGDTFYISKARYSPSNDVRFTVGDLEIITPACVILRGNARPIANEKKYLQVLLSPPSFNLCLWDEKYSIPARSECLSPCRNVLMRNIREFNRAYPSIMLNLINQEETKKTRKRYMILTNLIVRKANIESCIILMTVIY